MRSMAPALGLLALAALAGCATPPPPAVTAYTHEGCGTGPELGTALGLAQPKPKTNFAVPAKLDASAACMHGEGGDSPYRLFVLPKPAEAKTFTVGAVLEGARLVAPKVALLDDSGKVARTFEQKDFFFRGPVYSVQFRPRPGEAYILITVDRARIGARYDSIAVGTTTTTSTTAQGASFSWTSGVDQSVSRGFSYEGEVVVTVYDPDAAPPR